MIMISYFSIALIVFLVWFKCFWNDTATAKNDLISWIALVIGSLVWPVCPYPFYKLPAKSLLYKQLNASKNSNKFFKELAYTQSVISS